MEEFHAIVRGRVQMVMFRDFTSRTARRLGLSGFVRNLPDGSVEVVAQGEQAAVERLVTKLGRGPLLARVTGVDSAWREATEAFRGFEIRK